MKHLTFALAAAMILVIGISSCGNKKNNTMADNGGMMMDGEVIVSQQNGECALWIMTTKTSSVAGFYPVNLDDQFKVNGLKIAFNYSDSRAPLPENCQTLKAIVISEVKILK